MDPAIVRRALELGLLEPGEADHYLRDGRPARPLTIVPRTPPPPERLRLVVRPDGRIRRGRNLLTKALIAAGVLSADAVKVRPTTVPEEDTA